MFSNKAYRNFLGIFLSFQVAVDLVLALFIFYIDIVVLQFYHYELIVGTLLVCSMLLMPVMGQLAQRRGKAFPLYVGLPIWMATTLVFIFLDSSVPVIVLCVLAALIAVGSAAGNLSTWSMLTDIFDVDELLTSRRREGLYSGVTTFIRKVASGIAVLFLGFGFQLMGFDQNEYTLLKASLEDFDPATFAQVEIVTGMRWMFVAIPFVLLGICLFFAWKNKLTKRRFEAVQKGIRVRKGTNEQLNEQEIADIQVVTGLEEWS